MATQPTSTPPESIEVPVLNSPPTDKLIIEPSPQVVTHAVLGEAYAHMAKNVPGVVKYDIARMAANIPVQDRFIHGKFPSPHKTAELLERQILPFVRHSLIECAENFATDVMIRTAISKAFMKLDDALIESAAAIGASDAPTKDQANKLTLARSRSCALLSIYDPSTGGLHVARTGTSKALLGERDSNRTWWADGLSKDQTLDNEMNVAKVNLEHTEEKDIFRDRQISGMRVIRSFGNGLSKWLLLKCQPRLTQGPQGYLPMTPAGNYEIPRYLTAKPLVTTRRVLGKSCFLIMGSAGFWAAMTDDQALELVESWLVTLGERFGMTKFSEDKTRGGDSREGSNRRSNTRETTEPLRSKPPGLSSPKVDIQGPNNTKETLDQRMQTMFEQLCSIRQKYEGVSVEEPSTQEFKSSKSNSAPGSQNQELEPVVQGLNKGPETKGNNTQETRACKDDIHRIDTPMSIKPDDKDEAGFCTDEDDGDYEDGLSGKRNIGSMDTEYAAYHFSTFQRGSYQNFVNEWETTGYDNAAFFLLRNALSEWNRRLMPYQPAAGGPTIQTQRDNITVQVVFFHPRPRDGLQSFIPIFK
ncbi:hypothetical protein GQX73_g2950 [Xylaria multiplex]|uniref:PPM-type phosphatase domain-containing protein n=1 Tax=Xylaria multiplex TaxID=323545 RepID=A0A7C8J063_9PEZI|nr:hypothetical protein GQX73_g2950 [Xylaria multiplex]